MIMKLLEGNAKKFIKPDDKLIDFFCHRSYRKDSGEW